MHLPYAYELTARDTTLVVSHAAFLLQHDQPKAARSSGHAKPGERGARYVSVASGRVEGANVMRQGEQLGMLRLSEAPGCRVGQRCRRQLRGVKVAY